MNVNPENITLVADKSPELILIYFEILYGGTYCAQNAGFDQL